MASLPVVYRPHTFEDVCGQKSIIRTLERQVESGNISNCYLFCGPSGTGKTTLARIFANRINKGLGSPYEVDAASNNGVDNIREIIEGARERSIESEYKIYIIDEVHMLTLASWNALLKTLEETPKYTIFMLCTTDPQKIPQTIINRCQKFNLTKIDANTIYNRLCYVCENEHLTNYTDACNYIARISDGCVRQAIAHLEKVRDYVRPSTNISMQDTLDCLGNFSYDILFNLTNAIIDKNDSKVIEIIESYYDSGSDLKVFIDQYIEFVLDLTKYCLFKTMSVTKIPTVMEHKIIYTTGSDSGDNSKYFKTVADKLLKIKNLVKNDSSIKTTIIISLLNLGAVE